MMNFLVLQHIDCEHPGIFRDFMREDGVNWDTINLHKGHSIGNIDDYDALIVMGGPMDVWQTEANPWLEAEIKSINYFVKTLNKPYFGFCLGHQLLAVALGGEVMPSKEAEIGVLEVELTEDGRASHFFKDCPLNIACLQWHSAEIIKLPSGAKILASSPNCRINAMSWGKAFSLQFHVEITKDTVAEWVEVLAYKKALRDTFGLEALTKMDEDVSKNLASFNKLARKIYNNFMAMVRQ